MGQDKAIFRKKMAFGSKNEIFGQRNFACIDYFQELATSNSTTTEEDQINEAPHSVHDTSEPIEETTQSSSSNFSSVSSANIDSYQFVAVTDIKPEQIPT